MSRPGGRHAPGVLVTEVRPRLWDQDKKAAADLLDRMEPGWHVMYGLWSRRFYAIAVWQTEPLIEDARSVEELCERMRAVEAEIMPPEAPRQRRVA
ncbi:hypothetical protein Ssi03_52390 [Sphaerisporangium siamense]|uniref:Uncharacterized protein n=1 Tax=Sphaerisporangium siamense TaxID=795645 RepID=A0A7W7D854_9ACTN|nr:hypothetical protein [Sphaerisporangium siamense]MBB4702059.1 hypothetical protein [Sphaerisporangium siamense]GII87249.1 hypothetical protein Ssi03_52390 [Sphaerisporangium siamense]